MGYKINKEKLKKFINVALESGFHDEESARDHLSDVVDNFNKLSDPVQLYRIVFLNKKSDLNKSELGSHYVLSKQKLIRDHYSKMLYHYSKYENAKPFILTVSVDKNKIDFDETITNNLMYPHEEEITLKNKGKGANIISLEELKR